MLKDDISVSDLVRSVYKTSVLKGEVQLGLQLLVASICCIFIDMMLTSKYVFCFALLPLQHWACGL